MISASDPIPISALKHAVYCLRQAALIHVERAWADNRFTAEGEVLHAVADKGGQRLAHGVRRVMALPLASRRLGLTGTADVVEFHPGPGGEVAYPVDYKRGKPKRRRADEVQLCAQALCLEEMTGRSVPEGALFYAETRRRQGVTFDAPFAPPDRGDGGRTDHRIRLRYDATADHEARTLPRLLA